MEEAAVVAACRLKRRRKLGVVDKVHYLALGAHSDPAVGDGDSHCLSERVEAELEPGLVDPDRDQLAGLVGRDQQRTAGSAQQLDEGRAVAEGDLPRWGCVIVGG